jgi:hypothetical protein
MAEQKEKFDIEFAPAPEKGKACHMQVDHDLHQFILLESAARGVTFRKMANTLLCSAIQEYIRAKKMNKTIRNRTA